MVEKQAQEACRVLREDNGVHAAGVLNEAFVEEARAAPSPSF